MFGRIAKFRKGDAYEDLDKVEMDITDPAMRRYVGIDERQGETNTTQAVREEPPEETFTIQQAIDNIGFGKFQIKLSILTGVAWMADAMEMMILSILSPALHCDWQINEWKQAIITMMVFCGMMCSSSIWGSICDKYGRKSELILCSVFTCYFGFLSAFAPNFIWLLIIRGLVGFGIGGAPQSVTLYSEFLPTASRATCVILVEVTTPRPELSTPNMTVMSNTPRLHLIALNEPHNGRLRGIRGADYLCHREARQSGMNGTFRAFLSSSDQNLDSLIYYPIDRNVPIVNSKDEVLFNSWNDMLNGAGGPFNQGASIYSFNGENIKENPKWPMKVLWHGSDRKGNRMEEKSCRGWSSHSRYANGIGSSINGGKMIDMDEYSCNNAFAVLCVEITAQKKLR